MKKIDGSGSSFIFLFLPANCSWQKFQNQQLCWSLAVLTTCSRGLVANPGSALIGDPVGHGFSKDENTFPRGCLVVVIRKYKGLCSTQLVVVA